MDGPSPASEAPLAGRVAGLAGAIGGGLWAALPVVAALAFSGVEAGRLGLAGLALLGGLFQFAGLSVVGMLAGVVGLHRRYDGELDRLGRLGTRAIGVGFALLLPGSVVPSGWVPASLAALVPLAFFVGLGAVAVGSLTFGLAARRRGIWPPWLAFWFSFAMPVGAAVGWLVAMAGVGNLALVLGLLTPYGLAWVIVGVALVRRGR